MATRRPNGWGPVIGVVATLFLAGAGALVGWGDVNSRLKAVETESKVKVDAAEATAHADIDSKASRCCEATQVNARAVERVETSVKELAAEQRKMVETNSSLAAEVRALLRAQRHGGG